MVCSSLFKQNQNLKSISAAEIKAQSLKPSAQRPLLMRFSRPLDGLQIHAFFRHLIKRREFAQPSDGLDDFVGHIIHFRFGVETSNSEPNRTVCQIISSAQRLQYI